VFLFVLLCLLLCFLSSNPVGSVSPVSVRLEEQYCKSPYNCPSFDQREFEPKVKIRTSNTAAKDVLKRPPLAMTFVLRDFKNHSSKRQRIRVSNSQHSLHSLLEGHLSSERLNQRHSTSVSRISASSVKKIFCVLWHEVTVTSTTHHHQTL